MTASRAPPLHREVAHWFRAALGRFTEAQRRALPVVLAGRSVLVSAPTGSGKTLAGFLGVFDHLARLRAAGPLPPAILAVYVSPLRALAYDIEKNLRTPLAGLGWNDVRVGVRTGDTPARERAAQRRSPPHLLVTTPESLLLLLSQAPWHPALAGARFLIADELHAVAASKRGTLLTLAAEWLEEIAACGPGAGGNRSDRLVRVGLSATAAPLPLLAEFLGGAGRPACVVAVEPRRPPHLEVYSPLRRDPYPPAGYSGTRLVRELARFVAARRTTLIFTNTRSGAESTGLRLKQALPDLADRIEVHHAALDRDLRLAVEDRLKRGELRAVVCSTSLELGIDIGAIDTVVMLSAPKGVARALQRIGRSGHRPGATGHGVLVATNINDLAECAVTARMMARRALEPVRPPENALDVLAQFLVARGAAGGAPTEATFALVRRAWPFRALPRCQFDRILRYLAGGGRSLETAYRPTFGKLVERDGRLELPHPRVARDVWQNVGTINTEAMIQVRLGTRRLGQVEESFLQRLNAGDVFVLGGRCVRLRETRLLEARVTAADGELPTVPRWNANKMPLASGLCAEVVRLRTAAASRIAAGAGAGDLASYWTHEYNLSPANAAALARHFLLQARVSAVPTADVVLLEHYAEGPRHHLFCHSLIGRAGNDALSRIVAERLRRAGGGNALATVDDYGFQLTLRARPALDAEGWRALCAAPGAADDLRRALAGAELVKWQFRGTAQTGLMVPRHGRGERREARALQWSAEILFEVLRRHEPDHPLLEEAYREATLRFLDLPAAETWLADAAARPWEVRDVERPSPFAFGLYASTIKETMSLEDPETTIERLFHDLYADLVDSDPDDRALAAVERAAP